MRTLLQDVIFSFRQLRKNPAFALTSIVSLALGIAAATAVFSVVYAVLMNPYPYRDSDQLAYLAMRDKAGNDRGTGLSAFQIQRLRQLNSIESILAMNEWNLTTTDGDLPEDVVAWYLTPNAIAHLGVPPLLGRGLIASDAPEGQDPQPVVVLGYKFWQKRYGGRSDIVGQPLQLVHKTYTVVGVMPPRFTWQGGDVYLPLKLVEARDRYYFCSLRLKPGVTRERANAELQPIVEEFAKETPQRYPSSFRVHIQGLNDWVVRNLGNTLALLFAAVALMLLIGCGNVSILLLARGTARQTELAVRTAIGAARKRIVRQLLTESLGLSLCGTLAGVLLASQLIRVILKWMPDNLFPSEAAIRINLPVPGRWGRRVSLGLYFALMFLFISVGFGYVYYLGRHALLWFMLCLFFLGVGGANFAVYTLWLPEQYRTECRGSAFAFATSFGRFIAAGITFLVGAGVARMHTIGTPVALTSVAFLLGIVLLRWSEETAGKELPA